MSFKRKIAGYGLAASLTAGMFITNGPEAVGNNDAIEEAPQVDSPLENTITESQNRVAEALNLAPQEATQRAEVLTAWQNIPTELKARNRIEGQLRNPTPEFLEYLRLLVEDESHSMRDLYDNHILCENGPASSPQDGYEHFMDVGTRLAEKLVFIERKIVEIEEALRTNVFPVDVNRQIYEEYLESRINQRAAARILLNYLESRQQPENVYLNYRNAIVGTADQIRSTELENAENIYTRYTLMTRAAINPAMTYSLMLQETFRQSSFPVEVRFLIARAMMNSGYEPNLRVSSNAHLTMGFPHITFRTFAMYAGSRHTENPAVLEFRPNIENLDLKPSTRDYSLPQNNLEFNSDRFQVQVEPEAENTVDPISEAYAASMIDPNTASQLFYGLAFHNVNKFENYLRTLSTQELRDKAQIFMSGENYRAFAAIVAYFNHFGSTDQPWETLKDILIEADFDPETFTQLLSEREGYVRTALGMYDFISQNPEFNGSQSMDWGY
jgi:hypothetical protein